MEHSCPFPIKYSSENRGATFIVQKGGQDENMVIYQQKKKFYVTGLAL